jgi:hypothetical protein
MQTWTFGSGIALACIALAVLTVFLAAAALVAISRLTMDIAGLPGQTIPQSCEPGQPEVLPDG